MMKLALFDATTSFDLCTRLASYCARVFLPDRARKAACEKVVYHKKLRGYDLVVSIFFSELTKGEGGFYAKFSFEATMKFLNRSVKPAVIVRI